MVGKIHWSISCFLSEMGSCLSWSISLFFPKQLHAALILAYISSLVVSLRCVVCPSYLNSVTFSIFCWSISMSSLSAWLVMYFVFPLCISKPTFRLSEFRLFIHTCIHVNRHFCVHAHTTVLKDYGSDYRLTSTADITAGMQLGRAEVPRGLRTILNMDRPEHHSIDRRKERGMEKGSGRHSTLQGRERSVYNEANIGTVTRATLGRLLRDGAVRVWAFPNATMPSWAETETETMDQVNPFLRRTASVTGQQVLQHHQKPSGVNREIHPCYPNAYMHDSHPAQKPSIFRLGGYAWV